MFLYSVAGLGIEGRVVMLNMLRKIVIAPAVFDGVRGKDDYE